MPHPSAILFDWDDTIADNRALSQSCLNEVLAHHRYPEWDVIKKTLPSKIYFTRENFDEIFQDKALDAYKHYEDLYAQRYQSELKFMPGMQCLLEKLDQTDIPLGIVSNKINDHLVFEINHLLPKHAFKTIIGYIKGDPRKPEPAQFHRAFEGLGLSGNIDPATIWYVGDAQGDYDGAINCGFTPWIANEKMHANPPAGVRNEWLFFDTASLSSAIKTALDI